MTEVAEKPPLQFVRRPCASRFANKLSPCEPASYPTINYIKTCVVFFQCCIFAAELNVDDMPKEIGISSQCKQTTYVSVTYYFFTGWNEIRYFKKSVPVGGKPKKAQ